MSADRCQKIASFKNAYFFAKFINQLYHRVPKRVAKHATLTLRNSARQQLPKFFLTVEFSRKIGYFNTISFQRRLLSGVNFPSDVLSGHIRTRFKLFQLDYDAVDPLRLAYVFLKQDSVHNKFAQIFFISTIFEFF